MAYVVQFVILWGIAFLVCLAILACELLSAALVMGADEGFQDQASVCEFRAGAGKIYLQIFYVLRASLCHTAT